MKMIDEYGNTIIQGYAILTHMSSRLGEDNGGRIYKEAKEAGGIIYKIPIVEFPDKTMYGYFPR